MLGGLRLLYPGERARSLTDRSRLWSRVRICRRLGSATALNTSEVVAALAMTSRYAHMGICQACGKPLPGTISWTTQ
jgi:hypothetical protein